MSGADEVFRYVTFVKFNIEVSRILAAIVKEEKKKSIAVREGRRRT